MFSCLFLSRFDVQLAENFAFRLWQKLEAERPKCRFATWELQQKSGENSAENSALQTAFPFRFPFSAPGFEVPRRQGLTCVERHGEATELNRITGAVEEILRKQSRKAFRGSFWDRTHGCKLLTYDQSSLAHTLLSLSLSVSLSGVLFRNRFFSKSVQDTKCSIPSPGTIVVWFQQAW